MKVLPVVALVAAVLSAQPVGAHRLLVPASVRVGVFALNPHTMPKGYRLTYQHYDEMYSYSQTFSVRGRGVLYVTIETQAYSPPDASFCAYRGPVGWRPPLLGNTACGYNDGSQVGISFTRNNVFITVEGSESRGTLAAFAHRMDRQILTWLATH